MELGITKRELKEVSVRTKNGKAPGLDDINSELIKYISTGFKSRLLNFYDRMIKCEKASKEWNEAIVTPVFKKGEQRNSAKDTRFLLLGLRPVI